MVHGMHWLVTHRKKPKAREPALIGVFPGLAGGDIGGICPLVEAAKAMPYCLAFGSNHWSRHNKNIKDGVRTDYHVTLSST